MVTVINQNVPICPKCASGMHKRYNMFGIVYICNDNNHIWRVVDRNKNDNEIVVTDNHLEAEAYNGIQY